MLLVKTWLAKTIPRNYLWDWILSRGRSFVSAKVDHNPTFWYVCHPDAFKQLSLIQVEESSWAVLLSIFPTSFIPIFICCNSVHEQAVKWAPFHHGARRETKQRSRGKSKSSAWLQIRPFPGSHSTRCCFGTAPFAVLQSEKVPGEGAHACRQNKVCVALLCSPADTHFVLKSQARELGLGTKPLSHLHSPSTDRTQASGLSLPHTTEGACLKGLCLSGQGGVAAAAS